MGLDKCKRQSAKVKTDASRKKSGNQFFVILSVAKNLVLSKHRQTLRVAQGDACKEQKILA
jgi:hypothetical protein